MPADNEINPNIPDVAPEYVDAKQRQASGKASMRDNDEPSLPETENPPLPFAPPPVAVVGEAPPEAAPFRGGEPSPSAAAPVDSAAEPAATESPAAEMFGHREGECVPNTPDVAPSMVAEKTVAGPAARPEAEAAAAAAEGEGAARGVAVPSWLRRGYFFLILTLVSLFGIFIFSQAIGALSQAAALPVWAQYLLLVPLGLFLLGLLAVCVGLAHSWVRLRTVRQIDIAAMDELRERAETRRAGLERFREARVSLEDYMRRFPLEGEAARVFSGMERGKRRSETLLEVREELCGRVTDSHSWLMEFRDRFQNVLDRTAAERINSWSLKAAGCVMASPLPLLDAALILGISLKMIKDIATIYNVRCGGMSSLVLLNRTILAAFIAGATEYSMQRVGDVLGDELSGAMGDTALGAFGVGAVKLAAPRLGEGVVNALFMRRLGRTAIGLLQPLKP